MLFRSSYFEKYSEKNPSDEFGYLHQGTCLINLSRFEEAISQIESWVKRAKKCIVGADTIGKYPQTVILDLTYHGSEIYVHADGFEDTEYGNPGVTVNGEAVYDYQDFKKALEEN